MTRSTRHTPIFGITTSPSEKDDKRRAHRVERCRVRTTITADPEAELDGLEHPRSGGWAFAKDGKRWWTQPTDRDMRK